MSYRKIHLLMGLFWPWFTYAQTDLREWKYVREVQVNHSEGRVPLEDYQLSFPLDIGQLVRQGRMNSAGKDLRVTDSDGHSLLCHWVENRSPDTLALIWVRVPYLLPGEIRSLFVYYGNPQAESLANGACTFLLFDDFLGSSLDEQTWEWAGTGDFQQQSGIARFQAAGEDAVLLSRRTFSLPVIAEMQVLRASGRYSSLALIQDSPSYRMGYTLSLDATENQIELAGTDPEATPCGGYSFLPSHQAVSAGTAAGCWSLAWITGNTVFGNWPGGSLLGQNTLWTFRPLKVALGTLACHFSGNHSGQLEVDWVRVRRFSADEPSVSAGTEKRNTTIGSLYLDEGERG